MDKYKINSYFDKYSRDIRSNKEITAKEIMQQVKNDFELSLQSEIDELKTDPIRMEKLNKLCRKIINNRIDTETPSHIRIVKEYKLRSRLRGLFTVGKVVFLNAWLQMKKEETENKIRNEKIERELKNNYTEI